MGGSDHPDPLMSSRIHFHRSWYLSDFMVPSYGPKTALVAFSVYSVSDGVTKIRGSGWSSPPMGFYLGILTKWPPS